MNRATFFLKRNERDSDMIEVYGKFGKYTLLACVMHSDNLLDLATAYGDPDDLSDLLDEGVVAYLTIDEEAEF